MLDRGGDYLFALKANRPAMLKEVADFFTDAGTALPIFETVDADHGRLEVRRHRVCHDLDWLLAPKAYPDTPPMPGLRTVACVETQRSLDGRTTTASRYDFSSALLTPERFARAVRAHWAIENSLHWVLDVAFDEDRARNRADNGPENLAILRKLTLNVLQSARPKIPIARKRKRSGWSDAFARSVIGQMR